MVVERVLGDCTMESGKLLMLVERGSERQIGDFDKELMSEKVRGV